MAGPASPASAPHRALTGGFGAAGWLGSASVAYRWELRKLAVQRRSWVGIAAAAVVPVIFAVAIANSKLTPGDGFAADPMGTALKRSGLSLLPVTLAELAYFGPAIITALIGSDIMAGEDALGTLKTITTRSIRRAQLLAAKTLATFTYMTVAVVLFTAIGIVSGLLAWGWHPLADLSGRVLSPAGALGLTIGAAAIYVLPVIAISAFAVLLSVLTRQSVAAFAGTVFYVVALKGLTVPPAIKAARPYILTTQLDSWQAVFETPTDWGLIGHTVWVCALYTAAPLTAAWLIFTRRDITS